MKRVTGAVITGALFAGLIVLLKIYDVAAVGPAGTEVGFSHINQFVHNLTGVNMIWYQITDFIGYGAIAVCGMFAVAGFVQMIKRRSLLKVDREIWALGGLFIAVIGCYVFFEKYIINYRPIIMPGETAPEASFPSSHTVLAFVIFGAIAMMLKDYLQDKRLVSMGRLYCGVHWFTDIIGGILLSATLLFLFAAAVSAGGKKKVDPALEFAYDNKQAAKRRNDVPESTRGYKPKH